MEQIRSVTITEDGTARFERHLDKNGDRRRITLRHIAVSSLAPEITALPCIPQHCRFMAHAGTTSIYVCEDAPTTRTVRWNTSGEFYGLMRARLFSGMDGYDAVRMAATESARTAWDDLRAAMPTITHALHGTAHVLRQFVPALANTFRHLAGLAASIACLPFALTIGLIVRLGRAAIQSAHTRSFNPIQHTFTLAFPYVVKVFIIVDNSLAKVHAYYRNTPLESAEDALSYANVPNQNDGVMCMPLQRVVPSVNHAQIIADAEQVFWGSTWNHDLVHWFSCYADQHPDIASPWEWEAASKRDPYFMERVDWHSTNVSVRTLIARYCPQYAPWMNAAQLGHVLLQRAEHAPEVPPTNGGAT